MPRTTTPKFSIEEGNVLKSIQQSTTEEDRAMAAKAHWKVRTQMTRRLIPAMRMGLWYIRWGQNRRINCSLAAMLRKEFYRAL